MHLTYTLLLIFCFSSEKLVFWPFLWDVVATEDVVCWVWSQHGMKEVIVVVFNGVVVVVVGGIIVVVLVSVIVDVWCRRPHSLSWSLESLLLWFSESSVPCLLESSYFADIVVKFAVGIVVIVGITIVVFVWIIVSVFVEVVVSLFVEVGVVVIVEITTEFVEFAVIVVTVEIICCSFSCWCSCRWHCSPFGK